MYVGFKYRLYPNEEQKILLNKHLGTSRYIYNYFLDITKTHYELTKKHLSYKKLSKILTNVKKLNEYEWMSEVNSQSIQTSLKNLDTSFNRFFKGTSKFPKHHKKKNRNSFKVPQKFDVKNSLLFLPKFKDGIKVEIHRPYTGKIISVTISKTPVGNYFASFLCETQLKKLPKTDEVIGLDLGIKDLVITSDGQKFANPKHYRKLEKKLQYEQRQLSKKKAGSNNREKQRLVVAKLHQRIANARLDNLHNLHKISHKIINENQVIIVENLAVANMVKNHNLAKSISDCGWGEFTRQLSYKSSWYGRTYHEINRFSPSSKSCHCCGFKLESLDLKTREWTCPACQVHHDRDINAAKNIQQEGIKDLKDLKNKNLVRVMVEDPILGNNDKLISSRAKTCGGVRKVSKPMKQDATYL